MSGSGFKLLPEGRDSRGILPWVIGVMVYLCALAVAGGFGLRSAASTWTSDMARKATVQINAESRAERLRQSEAVLALLKNQPDVVEARLLSESDVSALLAPWLGKGISSEDLPVPALIDVALRDSGANTSALENQIRSIAPDAVLDTHQQWLGQLSAFTRSIEWTANLIVLLVALATVALVAFGTQAGLATHRATLEILHLIGAEDGMIAREYQWRFFWHGLFGGFGGLLFALATILLLGWLARSAGQGLIGAVSLSLPIWIALALLPLLAALLTMLTARLTVHKALRETL
jgi:cell division transport system permease protein